MPLTFARTALASFAAPPGLEEIGDLAFHNCMELKEVVLNERLQRLGCMCFLNTGLSGMQLPSSIKIRPIFLGLERTYKTAWIVPNGTEALGQDDVPEDVSLVVIPSSVRVL